MNADDAALASHLIGHERPTNLYGLDDHLLAVHTATTDGTFEWASQRAREFVEDYAQAAVAAALTAKADEIEAKAGWYVADDGSTQVALTELDAGLLAAAAFVRPKT